MSSWHRDQINDYTVHVTSSEAIEKPKDSTMHEQYDICTL